ncbi:MAG: restriction endonuclease [Steroidobacteraceae bacterium]
MAKRRRGKKSSDLDGLIGGLLLLGIGAVLVAHAAVFGTLFVVIVAIGVFAVVQRSRLKGLVLKRVRGVASLHIDALTRRRAQLVQPDAYGKLQMERWQKEIDYFIQQQVMPSLTPAYAKALQRHRLSVLASIEQQVIAASAITKPFSEFSENFTPAEFEVFCAQVLRKSGWDARVTKSSRDQGVDVIAARDGIRVVIQCKLYTGPVGNKAVQEISAGRAYENAHFGVVVSNSRYTASAVALAKTNRILLLHHRDLPNLHDILERWSESPAA